MPMSSEFCREQAEFHRERATQSSLVNVRRAAERAAVSWKLEAIAAERREQRQVAVLAERARRDAARLEGQPAAGDRSLSENPDRGLAEQ